MTAATKAGAVDEVRPRTSAPMSFGGYEQPQFAGARCSRRSEPRALLRLLLACSVPVQRGCGRSGERRILPTTPGQGGRALGAALGPQTTGRSRTTADSDGQPTVLVSSPIQGVPAGGQLTRIVSRTEE